LYPDVSFNDITDITQDTRGTFSDNAILIIYIHIGSNYQTVLILNYLTLYLFTPI